MKIQQLFSGVCISALLLLTSMHAKADNIGYSVFFIPKDLVKNANSVCRVDEREFELKSAGEAIFRRKYAITILNESAARYAEFTQHYNRFFEIREITGTLYDANGEAIKKVKRKDIQDQTGMDDASLVDESRFKVHNFYYKQYPYTVEYEVELRYNGTLFYPEWFPQWREYYSVQQSSYTFSCPEDYQFRYKALQLAQQPEIKTDKGRKIYSWNVKNLPAIVREPYSPGLRNIAPLLLVGPSAFEMQSYKGNMSSWADLGAFFAGLKKDRDILPDPVKAKVKELAGSTKDPYEKVQRLYEYMQANTRYISIQLGIGGWQPFDAKYVAEKKYGDCKALTNYMYSLLKEAGIKSYYAAIASGDYREDIVTDFPSSQFNHVILCVPILKDTMWLECTSQTESFGYLGSFTGNRHALLVDETGSRLARTTAYKASDNRQERTIKARLTEAGELELEAATRYTGTQHERFLGFIHYLSGEKVKERLQEVLDFPTYEVVNFDYKLAKGRIPAVSEQLKINVRNYATMSGKRLFLLPNIMSRDGRKLNMDSVRKQPVVMLTSYVDIDTIQLALPAGFKAESMPKPTRLESDFGTYYSETKVEAGQLLYYRRIEQRDGVYPPEKYKDLVSFQEAVYKADRSRLVLVKSETQEAPAKKAF